MMQLSDIRDYLRKLFPEAEHCYIGRIDSSQAKCIGVYDGSIRPAVRCLGLQTCEELAVSILVHWTDNARETDEAAQRLYDCLKAADFPEIGGHTVPLIRLLHTAPQDCTRPESPVYERVIEAVLIYNF